MSERGHPLFGPMHAYIKGFSSTFYCQCNVLESGREDVRHKRLVQSRLSSRTAHLVRTWLMELGLGLVPGRLQMLLSCFKESHGKYLFIFFAIHKSTIRWQKDLGGPVAGVIFKRQTPLNHRHIDTCASVKRKIKNSQRGKTTPQCLHRWTAKGGSADAVCYPRCCIYSCLPDRILPLQYFNAVDSNALHLLCGAQISTWVVLS